MSLELISRQKMFDGEHQRFQHASSSNHCQMTFAIYLPPQAMAGEKVPVLYWLSGLTCTDENFMQKAGAQRIAAELGIAIVAPDTSPRGDGVADDDNGAYDLGLGAGFYLNATQKPWAAHYQMYDYITQELPTLIEAHFNVSDKRAISGHSMGGHGALSIGLKNSDNYRSISAFSPITNPMQCPWGQKAFSAYLGDEKASWKAHDSCELIKQVAADRQLAILIDQGEADDFLVEQLQPQHFVAAAEQGDYDVTLRMQPGYDHSYFFIASFIEEHLRFHAKYLLAPN